MNCPDCDATIHKAPCACGWTPAPTPTGYKPAPKYDYSHAITLQAFGVDLFDCIKAFAGRNWAREQLTRLTTTHLPPEEHQRQLTQWQQHERACEREAVRLLERLSPTDQRAVLLKYEAQAI